MKINHSVKSYKRSLVESVDSPTQGSFQDLEKLSHRNNEGIVLLGAGGSLKEWIDGIVGLWHEEGICKTNDPNEIFKEAIALHSTGGRTDLALIFKNDAPLNIGKLAMWRLRFGDCSWVSDFVVNYREQYGYDSEENYDDDEDEDIREEVEKDETGKTINPPKGMFSLYFRKKGSNGNYNAGTSHNTRGEAEDAAQRVLRSKPDYEYIIRETKV